jgi:hypothetical protein
MTTGTAVPEAYQVPEVGLDLDTLDTTANPGVWWAVVVAVWGSALYYAWLCRRQGGYPDIRWAWSGFRVACNR